jgi:ergothioneine biosynthesis protein EgtB
MPPRMGDARIEAVLRVRRATAALAEPLDAEDMVAQSMPDASPAKWHLAHTTWFFERFVLRALGVPAIDDTYDFLFNSYYESVGPRHARAHRGLLTRPSVAEVMEYRRAVDARLADVSKITDDVAAALDLGAHHEQQHQELFLTDIQHLFSMNPLHPAYRRAEHGTRPATKLAWTTIEAGLSEIGHDGRGFSFDNERPRHRVYVAPFSIASRLVTCGEYEAFVADGGYERSELWLSDGWAWAQAREEHAPLYWLPEGRVFGLSGVRARDPNEPVSNVTYYEADAYARWAGARLATEAEWEIAAARRAMTDAHGACWQWTTSAYAPYPGFRPLEGAFGEYNGKFMVSQMVLRGSSSFTPEGHARDSYRNFFPPSAAWQATGIRLARDA